jgi:hypothetical protein
MANKLVIQFKSRRSKSLELKVCALVDDMKHCESLSGARNMFNSELPKIKTGNHQKAENSYKLLTINSSVMPPYGIPVNNYARLAERSVDEVAFDKLEIWHENSPGDLDRLIATVKEVSNG